MDTIVTDAIAILKTDSPDAYAVAVQHGRKAVGLELNPAYVDLALERIGAAYRSNENASNDASDTTVEAANEQSGQADLFALG